MRTSHHSRSAPVVSPPGRSDLCQRSDGRASLVDADLHRVLVRFATLAVTRLGVDGERAGVAGVDLHLLLAVILAITAAVVGFSVHEAATVAVVVAVVAGS